mgnify:CR=1 FL=1
MPDAKYSEMCRIYSAKMAGAMFALLALPAAEESLPSDDFDSIGSSAVDDDKERRTVRVSRRRRSNSLSNKKLV